MARATSTPAAYALLALALGPALAAVWSHPGFVTQDGPAHLYNAHILARSGDPASPFAPDFSVRWQPLPNWAGHLVLVALDAVLPPRHAERAMVTLTLVALAAALVWLRRRVSGPDSALTTALYAALLGLNVTWLFGFGAFLLGAALFPITLGVWWEGRDEGFSARRAAGLGLLVVLGYFCHLISLGLTLGGLLILEVLTPGDRRRGRAFTTVLGLAPALPLAGLYLRLMRQGGGLAPQWKHLVNPLSPRSWIDQFTWVDPISLARKDYLPLAGTLAPWHNATVPVVWLGVAVLAAILGAEFVGVGPFADRRRRGWWVLATILIGAGIAGPDTLGPTHGEYLQQRIVLLGLATLVPVLRLETRGVRATLLAAVALQSAAVWDYAAVSEARAGAILRSAEAVGRGQRIATRLTGIASPFRANPLLHADCALGVGTGNIVWSDYETRFYYFPVHFRDGLNRPDPADLERVALTENSDPTRGPLWASILERHRDAIDVIVTWGEDPPLDRIAENWFRVDHRVGPVTLWRRKASPGVRP